METHKNRVSWSERISQNRKFLLPVGIGAILLVAITGSYLAQEGLLMISRESRFTCERIEDPNGPNEGNGYQERVFAITYRKNRGEAAKPWLLLVRPFEDGFTPARRCDEIAIRLEEFRKDGLLGLDTDYSESVNLPIICAYTKRGGNNCQLLITLKGDDDSNPADVNPYEVLDDIAENLLDENKRLGVYQGTEGEASSLARGLYYIDLEPHLSEQDKRAGNLKY